MSRRDGGFSMVELLVALCVLSLLFAVAIPQTLRHLGSARTEAARGGVNAIGVALEVYAMDNGRYPSQGDGLAALVRPPSGARKWRGPYLKKSDGLMDPWGRPYWYRVPGRGTPFEVGTQGRDNAPGGTGEDRDIALEH